MKSILIFLSAVLAVSQAGEFKCPQPYLGQVQLKPVPLKNSLGVWYLLRATYFEETKDAACITQTTWKTKDTPPNTLKTVCGSQTNGTWVFEEGTATIKPSAVDGEVEPYVEWKMGNVTINSVTIESDNNGQHWLIDHTCFEDKNGNLTSMWSIMSRSKKIDPKLEQILAEKIEKHSGLTQDKLIGVRQTGCYDLDHKGWV